MRLRREIIEGKESNLLNNCIKETLRLYAPTFVLQSRRTVSDKHLPLNQRIWILIHGIHRSARYWPQPNVFNPDRFNDSKNNNLKAFLPFGHGLRSCPGQKFALLEIEAVMRELLGRYSIHLPVNSPHQDYLHCQVATYLIPKDLKLVFNRLDANQLTVSTPIVPLLSRRQNSPWPAIVLIGLLSIVLYSVFQ